VNSKLIVGRIVWAELLDPQGRNSKVRPAVLISPSVNGDGWLAVALTTKIDMAPADVCVELPWHRDGHPKTQLNQRNAAVCTWRAFLSPEQIVGLGGFAPMAHFQRILEVLEHLRQRDTPDGGHDSDAK